VSADALLLLLLPIDNYAQLKDTLATSRFSAGMKKFNAHSFSTNGRISAGYVYGVIPFSDDSIYPSGYFKSEGNVDFQLFQLPLVFQYYYTSLKAITGLNNYFRISFDDGKYREALTKKNSVTEYGITRQIHLQEINLQSLQQKLGYLKSLSGDYEIPGMSDSLQIPRYEQNLDIPDSLSQKWNFNKPEFSKINKSAGFSHRKINKDSISQEIYKIESVIKTCTNKIKELKEKLLAVQKAKKKEKKFIPEYSGNHSQKFSVKKFEIGLCNPAYSTFLVNGTAVNGINMEMESDKYYLAATYGKTMNSMQVPRNVIQNSLQNVRNLFNYFDFTDVSESKRIAVVKAGVGKKECTHFYLGLLKGKGLLNYFSVSSHPETTANKENNYVIELDGKLVFNPNNKIDIIYGKSVLQNENETISIRSKGFLGLINKTRSHAVKIAYTKIIPVTKTEVALTTRWVTPFFKSYGVGFIRSDNVRHEIKINQPVGAKIKWTSFWKRENDNLMSLYEYTNTLNSFGNTVQWKISRSISIKAGYTPVFQKVINNVQQIIYRNDNHISNLFLTVTPRLKVNSTFTGFISYYNLYSQNSVSVFKNYSLSNVTLFNDRIGNTAMVSWYSARSSDSINGKTVVWEDEANIKVGKGVSLSTGVKFSKSDSERGQFGYSLKVYVPLQKHLAMEAGFEKLILGDFYNNDMMQVNYFPYLISGRMVWFW